MSVNPCNVCGGTDLNLVDGFYYCVECGTQDVNVQETVVEHTVLGDGTFAHAASRKLTTLQDGIEMSGEWNKWHAYNFVLTGLVEELIALGAKPTVKMKVLWVWTRYIKEFQDKGEMNQSKQLLDHEDKETTLVEDSEKDKHYSNNDLEGNCENEGNTADDLYHTKTASERKCCKEVRNDITIVTKGLLLAILYVALNLDQSDILLSHIERYIREGRLNIVDCIKYVPEELNKKSIPNWRSFQNSTLDYFTPNYISILAMTCFKKLHLGTPLIPDMRRVVDNFVTELCLPKEFKNLVFSLMNQVPCDFLEADSRSKKIFVRIPDFEVVVMSYVLIALKMCFGLDDDYEIRLSDTVDKINEEENLEKSYKLGFAEPSDRLFSFREWCNYLQFRKIILCKYYLPMSRQHNFEVDDHVFMEHVVERHKRKIELSDQLTMDILNKIPLEENVGVIPKSEFFATLTPMSTYTDVIVKYIQDPEFSLLLSEDFSQYSLKYACEDLILPNRAENIVKGVSEDNKIINPVVIGNLECKKADFTMVYVRNCENKNWLKTNPPAMEHVTKIKSTEGSEGSDKDSDRGYDSSIEHTPVESDLNATENGKNEEDIEIERKLEVMEEEEEGKNIFDDDFYDADKDDEKKEEITDPEFEIQHERRPLVDRFVYDNEDEQNFLDSKFDIDNNENYVASLSSDHRFNPENFDREQTIKELILTACEKYKIPKPTEYDPKEPRKRKNKLIDDEAGSSAPKRRKNYKRKKGEAKKEIDKLLNVYYNNLEYDIINKVSENLKTVVNNLDKTDDELHRTINRIEGDESEINFYDTLTGQPDGDIQSRFNIENNNNPADPCVADFIDPSALETHSDNDEIEHFVSKEDPNFDEKTHHINQLYIKFKETIDTEDIFELNDPEIVKILDEEIEKSAKLISDADLNLPTKYVSDSDDDVPLIVLQQEKKFMRDRKKQRKQKLESLIKNSDNLKKLNYWFRHYSATRMRKSLNINQKFNTEIKENFPSSFSFVLNECASILNCTAYSLYKCMQKLEKILFSTVR